MKKVNLDSLGLSWFMSTGEKLTHKFTDKPLFIKGKNDTIGQKGQRNGCGKTVIFLDAVIFAFYGKVTRKDFKLADIPFNRGSKKKCVVSLKFDIDNNGVIQHCEIIRTINPSKLKVLVDGVDVSQASAATQEYIEQDLLGGISIDVFTNAIAMKLDKSKAFMEMSKPEREKFIGGVFDLTYIKNAEKLAREELNTTKKILTEQNAKVSVLVPRVSTIKEQIKKAESEFHEKLEEKTKMLDKITNAITNFVMKDKPEEISIDDLTSDIDDKESKVKKREDSINEEKEKLRAQFRETKQEVDNNDKSIKEHKRLNERDEQAKTCPTCKRDMDEDCVEEIKNNIKQRVEGIKILEGNNEDLIKHLEFLKEQASSFQPDLDKLTRVKEILKEKRSEISNKVKANQSEIREWSEYMSKLEKLKDKRDIFEKDVENFAQSNIVDTLKTDLKTTNDELTKIREQVVENEEAVAVLEQVKHLFSENGIRKTILGRLVNLFNTNVNSYLSRLEAPCTVEFDDTFNYTLKSLGGIEIPYGSLSGGERLRMTTALAFTFKDILRIQNQISFNISIYDEWFDAAIDERGLEIVSEILQDRKENYGDNSYIITHRTELQMEDSEEVTVIKEDNISKFQDG